MLNIKKNLKKTILAILAIVIFNNIFLQTLNADLVTASQKFVSCFEPDDSTQNISLNLVEIFGPEEILKEKDHGTTKPIGNIYKLSDKDFALIIEKILNSYMAETSELTEDQLDSFGREPNKPLKEWILQIARPIDIPRSLIFCALIYLERIRVKIGEESLSKFNIYRFFLVSIILASKMHEDDNYKNSDWSKLGWGKIQYKAHYTTKFLNSMEAEAWKTLDFKLLITKEELQNFLQKQYLFIKDLLVQNPHEEPKVSLDEIVVNIQ